MTDYKTDYSKSKNINTLDKGSFNDWGDTTPARQVLSKQPEGSDYDVIIQPQGEIKYNYNEAAAVAVGSEQLINTYTVPPFKGAKVIKAKASGENRAKFILKINNQPMDTSRIWWANFNTSLSIDGLRLMANDKIEIFVINHGDMAASFESTIGVDEYDV